MSIEITGKVKAIHPIENRGEYSFRKLWLLTDWGSTYQQTIELQVGGKKLDILPDGRYQVGDTITCFVNIQGREWSKDGKTSVFNTLSVWKIEKVGATNPTAGIGTPSYGNAPDNTPSPEDIDQLPF